MRTLLWLSVGAVSLLAQSCRDEAVAVAPQQGAASGFEKRTPQAVSAIRRAPASGAVDPRAERVCELLQRDPAARKAACCNTALGSSAYGECARRLDRALSAKSVDIDEAALDGCARASADEYAGCYWVTPSQALPPAACQALVIGRLEAGATCHSSLECVSPLHCQGVTPSEPGRCTGPEPAGAACPTSSDALAAHLMVVDVDVSHPICEGVCSPASRRCEGRASAATEAAPPTASRSKQRSAAAGEACESDFDCAEGGCSGEPKQCGMKCAVSLARADVTATVPALVLPRRSAR